MEQRVEINPALEKLANDLAACAINVQDMEAMGLEALAIIYNRTTREHLDCYGRPFKPYSTFPTWFTEGKSDYYSLAGKAGGERRKAKHGPNKGKGYVYFKGGYRQFSAGLYGDDRPNLMKTQEMLGSGALSQDGGIGVEGASDAHVTLDFVRPRERQKAEWNEQNGREFWGIGKRPGEVELLAESLRERVAARVEAAINGNSK